MVWWLRWIITVIVHTRLVCWNICKRRKWCRHVMLAYNRGIIGIIMTNAHSWSRTKSFARAHVVQWVRYLCYLATHTRLSPIRRGFSPRFVNYKKCALDSQVIKITSCLSLVGGTLRVLRFPPPLKLVAMI
jgi:hypothetical protein